MQEYEKDIINNESVNTEESDMDFYIPGMDPELDAKLESEREKHEDGTNTNSCPGVKNKKSKEQKKFEKEMRKMMKMKRKYANPRRRMHWSPLKILICAAIIFFAGKYGYNHITQYLTTNKIEKSFAETGIPMDEKEYYDKLKNEESDISGMTKYDKYEMGLMTTEGSDTDHDGLSDKEEIEIYGSDPLKSSTAGDLYTDGYKVAHDMELNTYYDYEDKIKFKNNECPEVGLTATTPLDLNAVVEDQTDRYSLDEFGIYDIHKGYFLYNYGGNITIDISNIINGKVEKSDLNVYVVNGSFVVPDLMEPEKVKFSLEHKVISVDYDFVNGSEYYVYVTGKESLKSKVVYALNKSKIKANAELQIEKGNQGTGKVLIYGSPMLEQWFGITGHIYYCEDDKDTILENAIAFNNDKVLCSEISASDEKKVIAVEKSDLEAKITVFKNSILSNFMWDGKSKGHWYYFFFIAYEYSEDNGTDDGYQATDVDDAYNGDKTDRTHYNNYHTEFDPYVDELPFQNFGSAYSAGGNCAGITHLTSYLFNNSTFPTSGSYDDIEWNIGKDAANKTLTDRGLFDYKSYSFVDDNSDKNSNYLNDEYLSAGEMEFVKMIGATWNEANDVVDMDQYVCENGQTIDYSIVDKITGYLDQGKIVEAWMYMRSGYAHAIILYDYYYNDAGEILFRVYDSNIPQNDINGVELNCDGACYLQCKKLIGADGTETFSYLYYPISGMPKYIATSYTEMMPRNGFVAMDENWNAFN